MTLDVYEWLRAEARSWPLSEHAAGRGLIELGFTRNGLFRPETDALFTSFADWVRTRARGASLTQLREICRDAWSVGAEQAIDLGGWLRSIASESVHAPQWAGTAHCARVSGSLERVRWMSLRIPMDLLLASLSPSEALDYEQLMRPSQLDELLQQGVVEQHVHLGAAMEFRTVWGGLAYYAGDPLAGAPDFPPERSVPFGTPRKFRSMTLAALFMRTILGEFIHGSHARFGTFVVGPLRVRCGRLGSPPWLAADLYRTARATLAELLGSPAPWRGSVHRAYRYFANNWARRKPQTLQELRDGDPLHVLGYVPADQDAEAWLVRGALAHLAAQPDDRLFAEVFWEYERVRCALFRFLVLEPGTAGLDWFKRAYDRIDGLTKNLKPLRWESAFRLEAQHCRLAVLEVRKAPPSGSHKVKAEIRTFLKGRANAALPNPVGISLIYHFLKEHRRRSGELHTSPGVADWRHGEWFRDRQDKARAIQNAIACEPGLLRWLRALDVASVELAQPLWLVNALIEPIRRQSEVVARPSRGEAPLRVTIHVAEEYRTVTEGLRRIWESGEWGILQGGDRLGHALALGESALELLDAQPLMLQPVEERLFDLLWLCRLPETWSSATTRATLVDEAVHLGADIFGAMLPIADLQMLRRLLFSPGFLQRINYPWSPRYPTGHVPRLAVRYLRDHATYSYASQLIEIRGTRDETELVVRAQTALRYRLRAMDVVVETNPSSNLLIGDFMATRRHPLTRAITDCLGDGPRFTINSDDPITFATRLTDEYAYMYAGLLHELGTEDAALLALDATRIDGLNSCFALPASLAESVSS